MNFSFRLCSYILMPQFIQLSLASRNVRFRRAFYDWELESVNSFVDLLYSNVPRGEWCDKMRWRLNASGSFDVTSYLVC
jgi:hypothetical protein